MDESYLWYCWMKEGAEKDTRAWRRRLTREEKALVANWDRKFEIGVAIYLAYLTQRREQKMRDKNGE